MPTIVNWHNMDHFNSPCGKLVPKAVLNMHDVKSSVMALTVCYKTNATQVMATSDHTDVACSNSTLPVYVIIHTLCATTTTADVCLNSKLHGLLVFRGSTLVGINEVTLRLVRLVFEWVTFKLSTHVTQPGHPSMGRGNNYQRKLWSKWAHCAIY